MATAGEHFSLRRRTAVVLVGEGAQAAYLVGVMRALEAAGVRVDVILGRGAGAIVAAFSAFQAEEKIYGEGGLLQALDRRSPHRLSTFYRFAAAALGLSFLAFAAPVLLGLVALVAFPFQAALRAVAPESGAGAFRWFAGLSSTLEPYYLPAIAVPMIVLFTVVVARLLLLWWKNRARRASPFASLVGPPFELAPLSRLLEARLWQVVRGASSEGRPKDRRSLGESYVQLLGTGLGEPGFREIVFYALDTDAGEEVPFAALREPFSAKLAGRAGAGRSAPIELAREGAPILFDALLASVSPPALVSAVPIKLPRGTRHGGEVHRFCSSLLTRESLAADAVACGAEQILYVSAAPSSSDPLAGSLWERLAARTLRSDLDRDLLWASERSSVPVFVIRPESERMRPLELSGRIQLGGERLTTAALVDQGEQDAERLFVRPVLGEELPPYSHETTVPVDREWEKGPREL